MQTLDLPPFARIVNDAWNRLLDMGTPSNKARRAAVEHAEAVAQAGRCQPKPDDWDDA